VKVLLDTCVAGTVYHALLADQVDVEWTGTWETDPGDETILAYAFETERILVTLDKDFGALAVRQGKPHAGIVRLVNLSSRQQSIVCRQVLEKHALTLAAGAIITADGERMRIRNADR
jgi:predicted nuclease of predicted toxin-antitoxin system